MAVDISKEKFVEFLDKFSEYLDDEREEAKQHNRDIETSFTRLTNDGMSVVSKSIDGLTKEISKLNRLDRTGNAVTTNNTIKQIETHTNTIVDNTDVIWQEDAEGNARVIRQLNLANKLLEDMRTPLETLAYYAPASDVFGSALQSLSNEQRIEGVEQEAVLVRLSQDQMDPVVSAFAQMGDIARNQQDQQEENNERQEEQSTLLGAIFGWMKRDNREGRNQRQQDKRQRFRDSKVSRAAWANVQKTLHAMKEGIFDMRMQMAFQSIKGILSSITSGIGSLGSMLGGGGGMIGKLGLMGAVGYFAKDALGKILDAAQANSSETISNAIGWIRESFDGLFDSIFGPGSDLAQILTAGWATWKGAKLVPKFFTKLLEFGAKELPKLLTKMGAGAFRGAAAGPMGMLVGVLSTVAFELIMGLADKLGISDAIKNSDAAKFFTEWKDDMDKTQAQLNAPEAKRDAAYLREINDFTKGGAPEKGDQLKDWISDFKEVDLNTMIGKSQSDIVKMLQSEGFSDKQIKEFGDWNEGTKGDEINTVIGDDLGKIQAIMATTAAKIAQETAETKKAEAAKATGDPGSGVLLNTQNNSSVTNNETYHTGPVEAGRAMPMFSEMNHGFK